VRHSEKTNQLFVKMMMNADGKDIQSEQLLDHSNKYSGPRNVLSAKFDDE